MNIFRRIYENQKKKCFEVHKNSKGVCYGLVGGDRHSDYTMYCCIGCPYHTFYKEDANNENT